MAIPIDETDLVSAWQQALIQLDLCPKTDAYVLALPASLPVRYAAVLTVINALVDFVARFPNPHPLLVVAGQDFGKALGMLLRPQLQQLPLAVIDEVIVRAGTISTLVRLFLADRLCGDGEITRISFLRERLMKLKTTLFGNVYQFKDVKRCWLKPTNCVRGCAGGRCCGKLTGARGGKAGVVGNDRSGHPQ